MSAPDPEPLGREASADELRDVGRRWRERDVAERYERSGANARWSSPRSAGRDPALVARALRRHGIEESRGGILDAPCGTGRLRSVLQMRGVPYAGLDFSPDMLAGASSAAARLCRGDVEHLPFPADCFDVVVCCRLLHHLTERDSVARVVAELVRVSNRLVLVSFWDRSSLPEWRRRTGLRAREKRVAHSKLLVREVFAEAGADVLEWRHSFRFVSQQVFAVARKR